MLLLAILHSGAWSQDQIETASDKYCGYLIQLSNIATEDATKPGGDSQKKLDNLMAMANALNNIQPVQDEAIAKRMTFEQFADLAKSKGLTVTTMYKGMYLQMYARAVCGDMRTEAVTIIKSNSTKTTKKTFATKQFDPKGQAYFDQMKTKTDQ